MSLPIKKICFIGAGTMGCFNSLLASAAGYDCLIYDPFEDALENRSINQAKLANFLKHENFFKGVDVNAAMLKAFAVNGTISEDRLEAISYGESRPVEPNDTAEGRAKNRRIEIEINY